MELIIKGTDKEIAGFVLEVQSQPRETNLKTIMPELTTQIMEQIANQITSQLSFVHIRK